MFGLEFTSKFPFIRITGIVKYVNQHANAEINSYQKNLINLNRNLLLFNQVPINKIRFVFQPTFIYEVDADRVNPEYDVLTPTNRITGNVISSLPKIEMNKPLNIIYITVNTYRTINNYDLLKQLLKKSKRGVVIYISDVESVNNDMIRFINLDEEIINRNI
jgi:hypothetical protein